MENYKSVP